MDNSPNGETDNLEVARRYLESRGILAKTATELYVQLVEQPQADLLHKLLRFNPEPLPQAVIVIPNLIEDTGKTLIAGYSLRFFPPNEFNGKKRKFLRTKGGFYRPYIPPVVWTVAPKLEVPIFIVEKQVAALLLYQLGYCGVALEGTWGAGQPQTEEEKTRNAKRTLHRDLAKLSWVGREVYLCFDSDFTRRESVLEGLIRAYILFSVAGASVKVLRWPEEFKGLDDYVSNGAGLNLEDQRRLITELTSPLNRVDAKEAAASWIRPEYLPLFDREGALVAMPASARNNLAHLINKPLRVSVGSLEKSWNRLSEEDQAHNQGAYRFDETIDPWPDPINGIELFGELTALIPRFIVLENYYYRPFVLWIAMAYVHEVFRLLPMLHFRSPTRGCGKSTALDLIELLVFRPFMVGNISASSLFRLIPKYRLTVLLDEAQDYVKPDTLIASILDGGYQVGRPAVRTNPVTLEPEIFDVFGPKALASIKALDGTTEDRCIIVEMSRKEAGKEVGQLCDIPDTYWLELRRRLLRWAIDNKDAVAKERISRPSFVGNRLWDKWHTLLRIAAVIGGDWPKESLRDARAVIKGEEEERSIGVEILYRLKPFFKEVEPALPADFKFVSTEKTLQHLNSDDEAPWANWKKGDNIGLTAERLARELKVFNVKSEQLMYGGVRFRGYWIKYFQKAFRTYVLSPDDPDSPPDDSGSPDGPASPDDSPPSKEPGDPTDAPASQPSSPPPEPEAQSDPSPTRPQNTETHRPPPKNDFQLVHPFISSSAQGTKATRVDDFNSSNKGLTTQVETPNPSSLSPLCRGGYEMVHKLSPEKGGVPMRSPFFSVISTSEGLLSYLDALPGNLPWVALDLETFVPGDEARGRKPKKNEPRKGTALDWQVARIRLVSVTVPDLGTAVIDLGPDPDANRELRQALRLLLYHFGQTEIHGHHLAFDLCFLEHEFDWRPRKVWDSWIAAELLLNDDLELVPKHLHPRPVSPGPTALQSVLKTWADIDLDKSLGGGALSDFGLEELSADQYLYSANDTGYAPVLIPKLQAAIKNAGLEQIAEIEMALVPVLSHMEIVGIPLRADLLDAELSSLSRKRSEIDTQIESAMRASGFDPALDYSPVSKTYLQPSKKPKPLNINSSNLKTAYFTRLEKQQNIKLPRTQKSSRIRFTKEIFESLSDPVAVLYGARAGLDTLINGINQRRPFIAADGRVHPIHDQLSANTGRISTQEPPMSNVPKDGVLRQATEAPEELVFSHGDLSLIEVRAQAHFTGEPTMIRLLNLPSSDPRSDIYRMFASWVESERQKTEVQIEQIPAKGLLRTQAKPPVLGLAYLMGQDEFIDYARGYGVEFTPQEALTVTELYFEKFPGIRKWHEEAWAKANADLVTEGRSHLGRRRLVLPLVPGDDSHRYRQAQALVNYLIQSSCADGLKLGLVLIASQLPPGAELILSVHDEVLVLCHAYQAEEVGKTVTAAMKTAYKIAFGEPLKVPIIFEMKALKNWSQKD
jgi:DNA polymerase I-like protein with 3'-5' exonuclease and polymerase domains